MGIGDFHFGLLKSEAKNIFSSTLHTLEYVLLG